MAQVEDLTQDSIKQPEQQLKDIDSAIAAEVKADPAAAQLAGMKDGAADYALDGIIGAAAGPIAGAIVALSDGMSGGNTATGGAGNLQGNKSSSDSIFTGGKENRADKARAPTPLVPMSYGEKLKMAKRASGKAAVRTAHTAGNIFAGVRLAGLSLTGGSTVDGKNAAMKGVKADGKAMQKVRERVQRINALLKKRDQAKYEMEGLNQYERNTNRLENDLARGSQRADAAVKTKPVPASSIFKPQPEQV